MLNIAFLCLEWPSTVHSGGVARYAYRIASALASQVNLTVVTFEDGKPIRGVRMVYIPRPKSRFGRFYLAPFRARRALKMLDVDVLHSFGDDWALSRSGTPRVRTFLGSSLSEARSSVGLRKLNHYLLAVTELISKSSTKNRIAIGPDSYTRFDCHTLMPPVVEVRRPTDILPSIERSVVFVGSFAGRKRGWLVEEAVERAGRIVGENIQLTVVGPSADASSWRSTTTHISGASDTEVIQTIARAWVLLAPSLYEGFGIPVFEALSLSVPVVASSNPGTDYLSALMGEGIALKIVRDDNDFALALAGSISVRAHISKDEVTRVQHSISALLVQASPSRLLEEYDRVLSATVEM
ncbi:glycosyltransferase family 4 protein [Cryobacterium ruanii]|uniref:Glycosyltransferase n=1 Tax=Cryobacterium ruanii TaxID=1259197 RepID=A0A4R9AL08_9MICO|nr:glycosyltransferase family 4 protein [Cryobacterium ruanii]TFD63783.1 glycosyltransferase [Cryobacterium ruanii]